MESAQNYWFFLVKVGTPTPVATSIKNKAPTFQWGPHVMFCT